MQMSLILLQIKILLDSNVEAYFFVTRQNLKQYKYLSFICNPIYLSISILKIIFSVLFSIL